MFSKDKDEIDDLFQETLIHLWQGFDNFRNESKIETWVYRVTMNTCISMDRKEKRRGERIPLAVDIDLFDENDKDMEQVQMLYKRIQKLGVFDRAIIMLWLENKSMSTANGIRSPRRFSFLSIEIHVFIVTRYTHVSILLSFRNFSKPCHKWINVS